MGKSRGFRRVFWWRFSKKNVRADEISASGPIRPASCTKFRADPSRTQDHPPEGSLSIEPLDAVEKKYIETYYQYHII